MKDRWCRLVCRLIPRNHGIRGKQSLVPPVHWAVHSPDGLAQLLRRSLMTTWATTDQVQD